MGALFELAEKQGLQEWVLTHSQTEIIFSHRLPISKHKKFIAGLIVDGEQIETLIQTKLALIVGIR
jgi:LEA14-like dessication related protein